MCNDSFAYVFLCLVPVLSNWSVATEFLEALNIFEGVVALSSDIYTCLRLI